MAKEMWAVEMRVFNSGRVEIRGPFETALEATTEKCGKSFTFYRDVFNTRKHAQQFIDDNRE